VFGEKLKDKVNLFCQYERYLFKAKGKTYSTSFKQKRAAKKLLF